MTGRRVFQLSAVAMAAMLLAGLFMLYQNPLFEIFLTSWGIC